MIPFKNIIYKNIEGHIVCWSFSHTKNILRIYEADICQKVKNTEAQTKKHYSYKKKSVYNFYVTPAYVDAPPKKLFMMPYIY